MAIGRLWAGRLYGTNTGNLFLTLDGEDPHLTGTLRFNGSENSGLLVLNVEGAFEGSRLRLIGREAPGQPASVGQFNAIADLSEKGVLHGQWETANGYAGTLELHPHDLKPDEPVQPPKLPPPLHTARHEFGAVSVDRNEVLAIADAIQREFTTGKVTVTVAGETENAAFLDDFRQREPQKIRANVIRLNAQEPEESGLLRIVTVEFGPQFNFLMTQGPDEPWVLGIREKLKSEIGVFERVYATNFKKFNIGINQLLLAGAIVYLPSLSGLRDRAILLAGVILIAATVKWLHDRYLPHAQIFLSSRPQGLTSRIGPPVLSWIIAATAGVAAALLAVYLQGWLHIPSPGP